MASLLKSGKKSVNLASGEVRVSKIRRDPPPKVVEKEVDPKEIERRDTVIGVLVFTLAIFVIVLAFSSYNGWSPTEYSVDLNYAE